MCCEHERILPDTVSMVNTLPMHVVHSVDGEVSVCVMGWLKVGDAACGDAQASHHCEGTHDTLERLESHHPSVCPLFCVYQVCVNCNHYSSHKSCNNAKLNSGRLSDEGLIQYVCICVCVLLYWVIPLTCAGHGCKHPALAILHSRLWFAPLLQDGHTAHPFGWLYSTCVRFLPFPHQDSTVIIVGIHLDKGELQHKILLTM